MANDPVFGLTQQRLAEMSMEIEAQLKATQGAGPIMLMLGLAREEAALALADLASTDAEDAKAIRALQNVICRYADMIRWLRDIGTSGQEAYRELNDKERNELIEMLTKSSDGEEQAISLGLVDGVLHDS
jgi:hypothetical protein